MARRDAGTPVRCVVFDLDGTLVDSVGLFYDIALDIAAALDLPPPRREDVYTIMRTGQSAIDRLIPFDLPDRAQRLATLLQERQPEWLRRYYLESPPIAGAVETIETLYQRGLRLGIATSSGRDVPFLDQWGVRARFGAVIGREDVPRRKPAPDPVIMCLSRLGCEPEEAVYVGDSPIDIQAGRAAGVTTVGVLTGTSSHAVLAAEQPDGILATVGELSVWLDNRLA